MLDRVLNTPLSWKNKIKFRENYQIFLEDLALWRVYEIL